MIAIGGRSELLLCSEVIVVFGEVHLGSLGSLGLNGVLVVFIDGHFRGGESGGLNENEVGIAIAKRRFEVRSVFGLIMIVFGAKR